MHPAHFLYTIMNTNVEVKLFIQRANRNGCGLDSYWSSASLENTFEI